VEQQIRLEQYLEQRELEQELDYEIQRSGDLVLPTVIVIPLGEETPPRQRIIIPGDPDAE